MDNDGSIVSVINQMITIKQYFKISKVILEQKIWTLKILDKLDNTHYAAHKKTNDYMKAKKLSNSFHYLIWLKLTINL